MTTKKELREKLQELGFAGEIITHGEDTEFNQFIFNKNSEYIGKALIDLCFDKAYIHDNNGGCWVNYTNWDLEVEHRSIEDTLTLYPGKKPQEIQFTIRKKG